MGVEYTRLTNLEVTGHLKVAGQEVTPGGGGGGVLVANVDAQGKLDKTWQQIHDAALAVVKADGDLGLDVMLVSSIFNQNGIYGVLTHTELAFVTSSASGYPEYDESGGGGDGGGGGDVSLLN